MPTSAILLSHHEAPLLAASSSCSRRTVPDAGFLDSQSCTSSCTDILQQRDDPSHDTSYASTCLQLGSDSGHGSPPQHFSAPQRFVAPSSLYHSADLRHFWLFAIYLVLSIREQYLQQCLMRDMQRPKCCSVRWSAWDNVLQCCLRHTF